MALDYRLEYIYLEEGDDSVFIHTRQDPSAYQDRIGKEDYNALEASEKSNWVTALFGVAGVVELSSKTHRVWIMKSPVYEWDEVIDGVLAAMKTELSETELNELPGSANKDGSGARLASKDFRRDI